MNSNSFTAIHSYLSGIEASFIFYTCDLKLVISLLECINGEKFSRLKTAEKLISLFIIFFWPEFN